MFEIGTSLRDARARQKVDLAEAEQATKIRAKYLRALEEEAFDTLPSQTYVKGFLRSYAEYLGLDGQLYVDEYNSRFASSEEHTIARPRRSSARPQQHRHRRFETHVLVVALTAIVAVTVLVFAAWKFGGSSATGPAGGQARRAAPVRAARPQAKPQPAPPRVAARPAPARAPATELVATAVRGDCWLEVHQGGATGRLLFQGTLERGQTQRFVGRSVWLNVGVPENLRLRLNGQPVRLRRSGTPQVLLASRTGVRPAAGA